jgi:hypothetical protein
MLQFAQFYIPLGNGASFGEAYQEWWDYIISGGFTPSEQYWHLGMVILGDATIMPAMHMLGIEEDDPYGPEQVIRFSANPAMGPVTVSCQGSFSVHDMTGRVVATGENSDTVSGLGTGVYIVRTTGPEPVSAKLCVIR